MSFKPSYLEAFQPGDMTEPHALIVHDVDLAASQPTPRLIKSPSLVRNYGGYLSIIRAVLEDLNSIISGVPY